MDKFVRRSGVSVCLIADLLEWAPKLIIQVGLGQDAHETAPMKRLWEDVEFVGFEAHPDIARTVGKTYPGTVINAALSDSKGSTSIYTPPRHKDGSSLFCPVDAANINETRVQVATADDFFYPDKHPRLLWLDCEGSELNVLKGAKELLPTIEVINIEMTARPTNPNWCTPEQCHAFLMDAGFVRQWVHTQRTHAGQYDAIYVRHHLFRPEYCCCPCQTTCQTGQAKVISDPRESI